SRRRHTRFSRDWSSDVALPIYTLWENNIYFERAIASFISFLNHQEFSPQQVREILNQVEREGIQKHGYGLKSFVIALVNTFERLDRKSTRLNSSHVKISYAVFC